MRAYRNADSPVVPGGKPPGGDRKTRGGGGHINSSGWSTHCASRTRLDRTRPRAAAARLGDRRRRCESSFRALARLTILPPRPQSAQGRGLSSATTVYLQAPPQTALPKPEHRPNCRCPVNNYRVVVGNLSLGGNGWDGHPWNTECFSLSLSASVH